MGIEPTLVAWEATALPLCYARIMANNVIMIQNLATLYRCFTLGAHLGFGVINRLKRWLPFLPQLERRVAKHKDHGDRVQ